MIANHPEREQIRLENVLSALGNPLRLEIIRTLADGSEVVIAADEGVICFDGRYRCPKGSSGKLFYHMVQDFVEGRD